MGNRVHFVGSIAPEPRPRSTGAREAMALLDRQGLGLIVLERSGELAAANAAGHALLERGEGLALRGRRVSGRAVPGLEALLRTFCTGGGPVDRFVRVRRPRRPPLVLRLRSFRSHGLHTAPPRDLLALFVLDPECPLPDGTGALSEALGLTPAEAEVACGIAGGQSTRSVALAHGRSLATTRTLLKRVYAKTGTHRQSALAALVLRVLQLV